MSNVADLTWYLFAAATAKVNGLREEARVHSKKALKLAWWTE